MTKETFLKEYHELCEKHKSFIGACGCCNSPWVVVYNKDDFYDAGWDDMINKHINHLKPKGEKYSWE